MGLPAWKQPQPTLRQAQDTAQPALALSGYEYPDSEPDNLRLEEEE